MNNNDTRKKIIQIKQKELSLLKELANLNQEMLNLLKKPTKAVSEDKTTLSEISIWKIAEKYIVAKKLKQPNKTTKLLNKIKIANVDRKYWSNICSQIEKKIKLEPEYWDKLCDKFKIWS